MKVDYPGVGLGLDTGGLEEALEIFKLLENVLSRAKNQMNDTVDFLILARTYQILSYSIEEVASASKRDDLLDRALRIWLESRLLATAALFSGGDCVTEMLLCEKYLPPREAKKRLKSLIKTGFDRKTILTCRKQIAKVLAAGFEKARAKNLEGRSEVDGLWKSGQRKQAIARARKISEENSRACWPLYYVRQYVRR